jgi:membrane protease YdiL (CAAX protease family)
MTNMLIDATLSALLNVVLFAGLPFLVYYTYHRWRHGRGVVEVARRAGLQGSGLRFLGYAAAASLAAVAVLVVWPPPLEPFLRQGSPQKAFAGLGLSGPAVVLALLYGVIKTGFAEELLFRGLIAGSLARRLPALWANLLQALIFLLPHLLILFVMPEMWAVLPVVFVGALFLGWLRIKSGSILGPWLIHATGNVTMCLSVAARTAA